MNTVVCDKCNRATAATQYCGHCGEKLKPSIDSGFIFPGLEKEIAKNLSLQKPGSFYVTNVNRKDGETLFQVISPHWDKQEASTHPSISVYLFFTGHNDFEHHLFKSFEEMKLFEHSFDSDSQVHSYTLDFSQDVHGAARLASKLLLQVYQQEKDSFIYFETDNLNEGSRCFVATATMGSADHPVVVELRRFRDQWLLKRSWGRTFTKRYYKYGRFAAKAIENHWLLRHLSFVLVVTPMVWLARIAMKGRT